MTSHEDDPAGTPGADSPAPASGTWRCPRCGTPRAEADPFCGSCGARRPVQPGARRGVPVARALLLNGTLLVAVVLVVLFARGDGPVAISFEPGTWRCDGTERAWVATVPASVIDVRTEWRLGGPEGEIHATATTPRVTLEAFATGPGTFRVTSASADAPECSLAPGPWTMALRDAANNALLAHGDVVLAAP